jgi:MFS family permease
MASEAPASAPAAADAAATFPVAAVVGMIYALVDANDSLIFAFLPGWFLDNGVSIAKSGAAFAANGIMMMITSLLVPQLMGGAGGAAKTFFYSSIVLCVALFFRMFLPLLVPFGPSALLTYYVVDNAFIGATWAFTEVTGLTWVMLSVPPAERTGAMAALTSARSLGNLVGPALGGAIYALGGLMLAVLSGIALLLAATLFYKPQILGSEFTPTGDLAASAKGSILKDPATAACFVVLGIVFTSMMVYVPFLEPFFRDTFGLGEWQVRLIYSRRRNPPWPPLTRPDPP